MAEELFSKRLPVQFKCPDREDRRVSLHLQMELQTVTAPLQRKELVVRLTDDNDLLFLYTLRLGEEDFQSLKSQQGLLVDFGAFPQKFIDLLETCLREEHKEMPKFALQFVTQPSYGGDKSVSTMNVIEINPFKHLTHLSLKFMPASDSDVKKHLASCLKQLKDTNSLLCQKLEHTDADLSHRLRQSQESLSAKTVELDNLKAEWTAKMNEQAAQFKHDTASEKQLTMETQGAVQQRYEREHKEMEQAHAKAVRQMETRLYELDATVKDLTDRKYKSEATIREQKSKLSSLEEEHGRAKQELTALRKQNTALDIDHHEQEKTINQLRTRVAVMEQELKDKDQVIARSTDLLESEQDKKRRTDDDLDHRQRDIQKLENKVKAMSEELMKGNEIIRKLQGEIKNYHAKIKLRNQIATEQEKLLGDKDQELEKLRQELVGVKDAFKQTKDENKTLSDNYESTKLKLEESRELLKTNENVIQWLNKQINETQLTHQRHGAFEMPGPTMAGFRPAAGTIHNYSTSSYGSSASHHSQDHPVSNHAVAVPRPYPNPHRQPQVHYNPGQPRKSGLPMLAHRSGPPPPIPEEIRPHSSHSSPASNNSVGDKENDPPLDPKYLQKRDDAIAVRGLVKHNSPPFISSSAAGGPAHSVRLSQQLIVPKPTQPPLASAYFPGQKMS